MGMYDESWCAACGTGMHYTEDENAMCHNCNEEGYIKLEKDLNTIIEYMKVHLISLEQDSDELNSKMVTYEDLDSDEYRDMEIQDVSLTGQMIGVQHILSVASDIITNSNERN